MVRLTRRHFATLPVALATGAASLTLPALAQPASSRITRPIPSTGEPLPAVGLGTAAMFDSADTAALQNARAVVRALIDDGGKLIDTASTYGDAERILGDVIGPTGWRGKLFIATKLEAADVEELKRSLNRLQTAKLDLLQLHNVRNSQQSLGAFRDWKAQGLPLYRHHLDLARHLRGAGSDSAARKAGFCADRLFDRRPRGRAAQPAGGGRGQGRCPHRLAVRPRPAVSRRARPLPAGLGARLCRELGTILSQISFGRPARNRGHPGHRECRAYGRQSWRNARTTSRPRSTAADDAIH